MFKKLQHMFQYLVTDVAEIDIQNMYSVFCYTVNS